MWEQLSQPWQVCLEEAWTAYCAGNIPIGAAITTADGIVAAAGHNRMNEPRESALNYLSGVSGWHTLKSMPSWHLMGSAQTLASAYFIRLPSPAQCVPGRL
jgi:hypothetical protein